MTELPSQLPDQTAGQLSEAQQMANQIIAAVNETLPSAPLRMHIEALPQQPAPPPVPQPGRAPMSRKASDASGLMLSAGASSVMVGGAVSLVLWASGHADPTVIAIVFGAPTTLALAIARVFRRAGEATEARKEIHQHFHGDVLQDHSNHESKTIGIFAKTNNPKGKS